MNEFCAILFLEHFSSNENVRPACEKSTLLHIVKGFASGFLIFLVTFGSVVANASNMSQNTLRKFDPSRDNMGNKNAGSIPYDERTIRAELKITIYKAARGFIMTPEECEVYYSRPDCTVLEKLFADAVKFRNWPVLERFIERIAGAPPKSVQDSPMPQKLNLTNLTDSELRTYLELNAKLSTGS